MVKTLNYNKYGLYVLGISILLLLILNPYYIWGYFQEAYAVVLICLLFFSVFFKSVFSAKKALLSGLVFILIYIYYTLNGASIFGALAFSLSGAFIFSINNENLLKVFEKFKFLYSLVLIPGLILWIIHFFLGNDFLYLGRIPDELNPNPFKVEAGQGYALYPFTIVLDYMLNLPIYRFMGPFDEPGRVGTISAMILAINNFKFKSKSDYVVLFSGLVSLSLAFYMLLFIYLAVLSTSSFKYFQIMILFVLVVLFAASFNETISKYTIDRISINDGQLSGDNRSNSNLDYHFDAWVNGSEAQIFKGIPEYVPDGSSSWKQVVVKTGLLGVFVLLSVFFLGYLSVGIGGYSYIPLAAFLLVFLASFYQRPDVLSPTLIMLFLLGISSAKNKNRILNES